MTFDELWGQVQGLPDTAKAQVPSILSENTKKRLTKYTPTEVSRIVLAAVDEIDHGSIETVDALVKKN